MRKISILCFDLSDNATGRADLLARLLSTRYEVEVVGPSFGAELWPPVQDGPVKYRRVPAHRDPRVVAVLGELLRSIDGDVIIASKPRPTSYGVGLMARARRRRPLILDIDDWELGFFYRSGFWGTLGRSLNLANPNGLPWSWAMERLTFAADAVTVASRFLERRFGGTLIPHVRDTDAWNPDRYDAAEARAKLGLMDEKVVMFLGTPRAYKGLDDLVAAVDGLDDGVVLLLVGVDPASPAAQRWTAHRSVRVEGPIPFDDIPQYLTAADVVAVPQRDTPDTIGQVPAKIFDAMALARPIVSTRVSMIPEILEGCGRLVPPGDVPALRTAIHELLADPDRAAELGRRARERCEKDWSFTSARARLFPLVERLIAS